jgi:hypothetical protein
MGGHGPICNAVQFTITHYIWGQLQAQATTGSVPTYPGLNQDKLPEKEMLSSHGGWQALIAARARPAFKSGCQA